MRCYRKAIQETEDDCWNQDGRFVAGCAFQLALHSASERELLSQRRDYDSGKDHRNRAEDMRGKLRRNFQGYTDDQSDVLIGLGASSLSKFAGGYLQNQVATGRYSAEIKSGMLA